MRCDAMRCTRPDGKAASFDRYSVSWQLLQVVSQSNGEEAMWQVAGSPDFSARRLAQTGWR